MRCRTTSWSTATSTRRCAGCSSAASGPTSPGGATSGACATSWTGCASAGATVLEEGRLADPLAEVRQELDEIVAQERAGVQRRLDETEPGEGGAEGAPDPELQRMLRSIAAKRLDGLDSLPPDVGARVRALQDYDFLDPDARQRFDAAGGPAPGVDAGPAVAGPLGGRAEHAPGGPRRPARDGPRPQRPAGAAGRGRGAGPARGRPVPGPARRRSSRAPRRSTTSSSSWPRGWPRCSR